MNNPYRSIVAKTGQPVDDTFKLAGQSSPLMDKTGEINANSVKDLLNQIGRIINSYQDGTIVNKPQVDPEVVSARRNALLEAVNDKSGEAMQVLAQSVVAEIIDTTTREGFSRRLMQYREIGQGENNEVRLRHHDVTAWMAVSTTEVQPIIVRGRKVVPPEFNVEAFILIDLKELSTTPGDLLEEKYEEGLEATMVQEDRLWKNLADSAVTVRNTLQYFTTFTPQVFSRIRNQVARWGIPVPTCLVSYDIWDDIIGNNDFSGLFDPVTKYELIQEGNLGTILGVTMVTDAFRQQLLRVLDVGEVYLIGAPANHGVITIRGSMLIEPINKFADGKSQKGWFMNEIVSMVLGNSSSIAKGQRI